MLPRSTAEASPLRLLTLEDRRPVAESDALLFSVAYDLELLGFIRCLELAGVPLLREDRGPRDPVVIAGGPMTFSNPLPLAPFCDAIVMGEGEATVSVIAEALRTGNGPEAVRDALRGQPHILVPDDDAGAGDIPGLGSARAEDLPAASLITTPHSALADMALVEAARGCSRGCTFCVMGRWTNGGMRSVSPERILSALPDHATRVGLVGAAVSDHPRIRDIMAAIVDSGRQVSLSSLRADRLDDEFVRLLAAAAIER